MNYFSKYIKRFQMGGQISEEDQQLVMAFITVPEAFKAIADQMQPDLITDEIVAQMKQVGAGAKQGDEKATEMVNALLQDTKTLDLLKQIYSASPETISQAMQQNQAQMMRDGGKVAYLRFLQKG